MLNKKLKILHLEDAASDAKITSIKNIFFCPTHPPSVAKP